MFPAAFVEKLADARQRVDDGLILRDLAIEHAQRIGYGAALAIGAHFRNDRLQSLAQRLIEGHAVVRAAHGIQFQSPSGDAEAVEQSRQHLENLRIPRRRLAAGRWRTNDLSIDLIKLPVAAFLRALAPEHGANTVELVQAA